MSTVFARYRKLVYAQIMLGLMAFSMAQSNPAFLLLVGAIAIGSWYLVEGPSGRTLPRLVTNLGALAAIAWLVLDLQARHTPGLVAIGHFMIWLQLLLLYGRRDYRDDAMALTLSLLLMVDASLLSFSMAYGVLLAVYSLLTAWTLLAFSFSATADNVARRMREAAHSGGGSVGDIGGGPPISLAPTGGPNMRRDVMRSGLLLSLGAFSIAVAVFVLTPRIEGLGDATATRVLSGVANIGFSGDVQLGQQLGDPDSQEPVLMVTMRDADGQNVGSNNRVWYLRGACADQYDPNLQTWSRDPAANQYDMDIRMRGEPASIVLASASGRRPSIEAEITIRQPRQAHLFSPFPPLELESDSFREVSFGAVDQQFTARLRNNRTVHYKVRHAYPVAADQAIFDGYQRLIGHHPRPRAMAARMRDLPRFDPTTYARGWQVQPQRVRAMAAEILAQANLTRDPTLAHDPRDATVGEALTEYLRSHFVYRIAAAGRHGDADPVIHFLFSSREGHCELFAAGLAALSRSIGMRARLVTGYLASEFNGVGGYYIVRPGNAHAWCEIEVAPDVWERFDPTPPADRDLQHHVEATWSRRLRQFYEHMDFLWIRSVVAYDPRTRQAMLNATYRMLVKSVGVRNSARLHLAQLQRRLSGGSSSLGFGLAALLVAVFLVVAMATLIGLWRRRVGGRRWWGWRRSPRRTGEGSATERFRSSSKTVGFYNTMVELLDRHGYARPPWQGPRAFASELANEQPERFAPAVALTDLFYTVRFGGHALANPQRQRARDLLADLRVRLEEDNANGQGLDTH